MGKGLIDYLDKYRGKDDRRSVYDILSLNPNIPKDWEIIKREYVATDIDKVIIDNDTFTNYGDFQFVWEKTYAKEPRRSESGVVGNLNSYATFITPHLIMNFSIMSIDDYRAIMRKDLERNEFVVKCYDPIYNAPIKKKMYLGTPEMAKLHTISKVRLNGEAWEEFVELVGVRDYTVELIGTNADLDLVSVIYHLNPPSDTGYIDQTVGEEDIYSGEDIIIGGAASAITSETFGGKYKFTKWNITAENPTTEKTQGNYINGYAYTINSDLVLYAQWEATTNHTLTYNYGLADHGIDENSSTYITSKKVVKGKSIGTLPVVDTPKVKAKDLNGVENEYTPYYNGKWYKTPIIADNSEPILDNATYWIDRDSTIYLLYDTNKYRFVLVSDHKTYYSVLNPYNASLNLPTLVKDGYTFDGWYYTEDFQEGTKVGENINMPPYNLILYARWVENK